ncbi:flagellar hook-length control protein FliK [Pseudomonas sp. PDM16]|uniref:flagellar hook-length control protein FliK n=1 Tax=Pseudomonas sp. PDM16 TaxID=2769292 RepID=UPI0017809759|nr:flagellar hook-length control protein FliK [Pseudomonas sp. PDM16]MBD9416527.1 flagellar hook-length control protein FliK [Pseudomonas sp. PDM16]
MSVAPDFLLQSAPEVRPKAAAAKAPAAGPEPRSKDASSFADVYAKERQAKSAERKESSAKTSEQRTADAKPASEAKGEAAAEQPAVAESGNDLPEETVESGSDVIDPLLLMAMTGQLPATETEDPALLVEEGEGLADELGAQQQQFAPVAGLAATGLTEANHDPELDLLNSVPGVKLALEVGTQGQAATQQLSPGAVAAERSSSAGQGVANALAAFSGDAVPSEEAPTEGLDVDLLGEGLDSAQSSLREGQNEVRAETFANKLNVLSQAINQQHNVQRLPLAPGQPVQVNHPGMSEAVVDKVMWLSSQNLKSAEIQLDPAELGRLEVRIELNKDQAAQVTFISANANVRDQLEGQAHRLRELFSQQGMNQLDVNVSDQSLARGSQGGGEEAQRRSSGRGMGGSGDDEVLAGVSEIRSPAGGAAPRGLVDYYA